MNNAQSESHTTTANYIAIIILSIVAVSGTAYIIFSAIVSPPFDVELSLELGEKDDVKCITKGLTNNNIPYEIAEHREKKWIVLQTVGDKGKLKSILANECSSFNP